MTNMVQAFRGTNKDIERMADVVCKSVFEGERPETNAETLRTIVERTGGKILVAEDPSNQELDGGSLMIEGLHDYKIFLSPYTTPLRDNFTIGHELGHYVLHFFFGDPRPSLPLRFARYGTSPLEWQANRFSAALLMPVESFQQQYQEAAGNLSMLSGYFDVSRAAVETRAKSLGLLQE